MPANRISTYYKKSAIHYLVGIALNHTDGHIRITQAERFCVAGGSYETHQEMLGVMLKTLETIQLSGKALEDLAPEEIMKLLQNNGC